MMCEMPRSVSTSSKAVNLRVPRRNNSNGERGEICCALRCNRLFMRTNISIENTAPSVSHSAIRDIKHQHATRRLLWRLSVRGASCAPCVGMCESRTAREACIEAELVLDEGQGT